MLPRAASRKDVLRHLQRSSAQLVLPWLCPALVRRQSQASRAASILRASGLTAKEQLKRQPFQSSRNLATATDQNYIPFEDSAQYAPIPGPFGAPPTVASEAKGAEAGNFDTSSLIIIDDSLQTRPRFIRANTTTGIGGNEHELMSNVEVCLLVGHFERAASLISRLATTEILPLGSPEFLELNNKYLKALVSHMIMTRKTDMIWPVQRWFEVDLMNGGANPDATSFALMIRMSLRMLHGPKRDRTVRRYWAFAKADGVEEDVLGLPILSELELGELSEICSADLQSAALGDFGIDVPEASTQAGNSPTAFPEIRPTEQKGYGLDSLKSSLSLFDVGSEVPYPSHLEGTKAEKDEIYAQLRQKKLEADAVSSAVDRWQRENAKMQEAGFDTVVGGKKLSALMGQWLEATVAAFRDELAKIAEFEKGGRPTEDDQLRKKTAPYFRLLPLESLAAVCLIECLSAFTRFGTDKSIRLAQLAIKIGKGVRDEVAAQTVLKSETAGTDPKMAKFRKAMISKMLGSRNTRKGRSKWKDLVQKAAEEEPALKWTPATEALVGGTLANVLFKVCKMDVEVDGGDAGKLQTVHTVFQHTHRLERGRRFGYVSLHPELVAKMRREPPGNTLAKYLPMVSKPKPWTSFHRGGFLSHTFEAMRIKHYDHAQRNYAEAAAERGDLDEIFKGLNVLGETGWKINQDVFAVMTEAWNSGEEVGGFPPANPQFDTPERPANDDPAGKKEWWKMVRSNENKRSGLHSQRCFQNFQLEIARSFINETFYLPHNMDFRGRAYPLPPYLNQMGADNCRGLFLFSEGRKLGASGLRWLKIHLANLYGFDKASLQEREAFTMDHLDDILDSANQGLHGRKWWLQAEDSWQCLAACCELRNALRLPDPTEYISHLPIHQDGSCNGLQHYAALGGDVIGAQQVNLEPSDRPSDVYTGVAEFVKAEVAKDAADGDSIAKLIDGKITRKIVKQTVMTNVYGVTFLGAIRQVRRQLEDYYPDLDKAVPLGVAATFITRKIFKAMGSIFNGAHQIQYWLGDCASRICQSVTPEQIETLERRSSEEEMDPNKKAKKGKKDETHQFSSTLIWTTPLKLPVVQPYREASTRRIKTSLQDISIREAHSTDVVNKRKQLQAFPPNFIHSLDATHMILSAVKCKELGLTFSAVHDSFWTHAADIDTMNLVLRDAFVRMHSDDIVKRLAAEFNVRYGRNMYLAQVKGGSAVGRAITQWRRQIAGSQQKDQKIKPWGKKYELLAEAERQRLLASNDPTDQEEGRAMVTGCSIFEQFSDAESALMAVTSLGETAIGHVPEDADAALKAVEELDEIHTSTVSSLAEDDVDDSDVAMEEDKSMEMKRTKKASKTKGVWLWMPLTFRPVPAKGEFDVTRLKESEYFFS